MNIVNGWSKAELNRISYNLVTLHKQIAKSPITMRQAKLALLSVPCHDIGKYVWHDLIRMAFNFKEV